MKTIRIIFGIILGIGLLLWAMWGLTNSKDTTIPTANSSVDVNSSSSQAVYMEYTTPCEVAADYAFYLESDDPIAQKFPGISEVIIYSGKGKSNIPNGRWKGPIKFFDPSDPLNGHKSFRIYPVK